MFLVEFFLKLLEFVFFNFVLGECFEVVCEVEEFYDWDELFGGVVLLLFNSVVEIIWEFVVEVVVIFIKGDEGSDDMIFWWVVVIKGLVVELVGEGVDVEGGLLNEKDVEDIGIDEVIGLVVLVEIVNEGGNN